MDEWSLAKLEKEDGSYWVIRKNLHPIAKNRSQNEYPICIYLTFHYQAQTQDGFPSTIDNDAFEVIESKIASICDGEHSTFVATVFMPQIKDFIIYTSNPDRLSDLIEPMVRPYKQFKVEFGGNEDPSWNQYGSFV